MLLLGAAKLTFTWYTLDKGFDGGFYTDVAKHVRDGQGLVWLRQADVAVAWITGRGCRATERRAAELGVDELYVSVGPKEERLAEIQARLGLS